MLKEIEDSVEKSRNEIVNFMRSYELKIRTGLDEEIIPRVLKILDSIPDAKKPIVITAPHTATINGRTYVSTIEDYIDIFKDFPLLMQSFSDLFLENTVRSDVTPFFPENRLFFEDFSKFVKMYGKVDAVSEFEDMFRKNCKYMVKNRKEFNTQKRMVTNPIFGLIGITEPYEMMELLDKIELILDENGYPFDELEHWNMVSENALAVRKPKYVPIEYREVYFPHSDIEAYLFGNNPDEERIKIRHKLEILEDNESNTDNFLSDEETGIAKSFIGFMDGQAYNASRKLERATPKTISQTVSDLMRQYSFSNVMKVSDKSFLGLSSERIANTLIKYWNVSHVRSLLEEEISDTRRTLNSFPIIKSIKVPVYDDGSNNENCKSRYSASRPEIEMETQTRQLKIIA